MKKIQSRDNAFYKSLVKLAGSSRARRQSSSTILDGIHLIQAYAASGQTAQALIFRDSNLETAEVHGLVGTYAAEHTYILADGLFDSVAQVATPTGIMALVSTPPPLSPPNRVGDAVLLEEIQDPGNLGSILRTSLGAGIRRIYLSSGSVFAWSPKVIRAGMGAHFHLSICENVELRDLSERAACRIIAAQSAAATEIYDVDLSGPTTWMFGNEGAGLSRQALDVAGLRVVIPMAGYTESLNVAAAVAICLFEQGRQRRIS